MSLRTRLRGADMTRDETVAMFLASEAKRAEVRANALSEGKEEHEADEIAHEAAKAHWNAWADALLAERKAMEADGRWASEGSAWQARSNIDFTRCVFVNGVRNEFLNAAHGEEEAVSCIS